MSEGGRLRGRRIALGVSGGIAAYKAIETLRLLTEQAADVRVIMTPEATRFVAPLTFEALSNHPVACDWLDAKGNGEPHIELAQWAEVLAIVPATANTMAKLATGLADEILSGTALASRAPLVLAPAMHAGMFTHPATEEQHRKLEERGAIIVMPVVGRLASGESGVGRLAAPGRIAATVEAAAQGRHNLRGTRVLVSAGGTKEAFDPVRYIGNFSSGKMGRAMAEVAAARGATVTLVTTAPAGLEGIEEIPVTSAKEMLAALENASVEADILVMVAAVADYVPETVAPTKLHRTDQPLTLTVRPNLDVLKQLGRRNGLFRVGFAAETEQLESGARKKLALKDLDLIVANDVGHKEQGIGSDFNAVTILALTGAPIEVPRLPKWEVAERIWDAIDAARHPRS